MKRCLLYKGHCCIIFRGRMPTGERLYNNWLHFPLNSLRGLHYYSNGAILLLTPQRVWAHAKEFGTAHKIFRPANSQLRGEVLHPGRVDERDKIWRSHCYHGDTGKCSASFCLDSTARLGNQAFMQGAVYIPNWKLHEVGNQQQMNFLISTWD